MSTPSIKSTKSTAPRALIFDIETLPTADPTREELIQCLYRFLRCGAPDEHGRIILCKPNIGDWQAANEILSRCNPSESIPQPTGKKCSICVL